MHRNTELNTIYCVTVQYIGKGMKKESKKVKKDWKKVLTKGGWRGIIIELSESGTPERSDRNPNSEPVREASRG